MLARTPKVAMYLFEQKPGQDQYNEHIRNGIKPPFKPAWVMDNEAFITVVAKLVVGTKYNEKELNLERPKRKDGIYGDKIPRQVYVRAIEEVNHQWTLDDHKAYTRRLAKVLNQEIDISKKRAPNDAWKYNKSYIVDEEQSWDSIPDDKYPLGMYMQDNVMKNSVMSIIFGVEELTVNWAQKYPDEVDHFFVRGGTATSNSLGVDVDYVWNLHEAVTDEDHTSEEQSQASSARKSYDLDGKAETTDEEQYMLDTGRRLAKLTGQTGGELKGGKKRTRSQSKKNPYIDDEAEEDDA